jgi:hypothetical protein
LNGDRTAEPAPPPTQLRDMELTRLRDIGWSRWDPIGLAAVRDECVDEYDSYLLQAFERLARGDPVSDVAAYLMKIEAEYMGLGQRGAALSRATATAAALRSYICELSGADTARAKGE